MINTNNVLALISASPEALHEIENFRPRGAVLEAAKAAGIPCTWDQAGGLVDFVWDNMGNLPQAAVVPLAEAAEAAAVNCRACAGTLVGGPGPSAADGVRFAAAFG
jgi:glycosyltransferase involved in cell wall biosynthesis